MTDFADDDLDALLDAALDDFDVVIASPRAVAQPQTGPVTTPGGGLAGASASFDRSSGGDDGDDGVDESSGAGGATDTHGDGADQSSDPVDESALDGAVSDASDDEGSDEAKSQVPLGEAALGTDVDLDAILDNVLESVGVGPSPNAATSAGGGGGGLPPGFPFGGDGEAPANEDELEAMLRDTLARLTEAVPNAPEGASMEEVMANMTDEDAARMLESLGMGAGGPGGDPAAMDNMLMTMMQALLGKGVVLEPLQDMRRMYDKAMAELGSDISADDMTRYHGQMEILDELIRMYTAMGDDDELSSDTLDRVMDLFGHMQEYGSPPEGVMEEIGPEMEAVMGALQAGGAGAADGSPVPPGACTIS